MHEDFITIFRLSAGRDLAHVLFAKPKIQTQKRKHKLCLFTVTRRRYSSIQKSHKNVFAHIKCAYMVRVMVNTSYVNTLSYVYSP